MIKIKIKIKKLIIKKLEIRKLITKKLEIDKLEINKCRLMIIASLLFLSKKIILSTLYKGIVVVSETY